MHKWDQRTANALGPASDLDERDLNVPACTVPAVDIGFPTTK